MTLLTITARNARLFTPELHEVVSADLRPGNAADVIGVGDSFAVEGDSADDVYPLTEPTAWTFPDGAERITSQSLYHAPLRVQRQASAAYFVAWSNSDLKAAVDQELLEMAELKQFEAGAAFETICLSFGVLILSLHPTVDMCTDATEAGEIRITQRIVDANIRLLLDTSISAHARINALPRAQAFIDTMISGSLASRSDRKSWDAFYDGVSLRIAAGSGKGCVG